MKKVIEFDSITFFVTIDKNRKNKVVGEIK